ncbi:hypothetical protein PGS49_16045 [Yersinia intermedia]|uniref:hypothetical protein n=1 Tax=Yersinia intermedia TaxID=631 RepID=UPI0022FDEF68|nr:hypothetical protein [Yersinia intermedia]MDA5482158.1 hypothetical protein [Yersinia intermedia]
MLSKEQLEKIANPGPADIGGAQNPIVTEMATELLSLREQLDTERRRADESGNRFYKAVKYGARLEEEIAALKQLPPFAEVVSKFGDPEAFGEREIKLLIDLRGVPYGTLLFTAAEPSEQREDRCQK